MTTEKIRLWHPFGADVVRKGQRKPTRMMARAPVDLEIESIGRSDLRNVGSVLEGNVSHAAYGTPHEVEPTAFYGYAGRLWTPMEAEGCEGRIDVDAWRRIMTSDRAPACPIVKDPVLGAYSFFTGGRAHWAASKPLSEVEGRLLADDQVASLAAARRAQENILIVDGILWRRQPVPMWRIDRAGSGNFTVVMFTGFDPYSEALAGNAVTNFRADRLEDAVRWCEEHGRMRFRHPETHPTSGRLLEFDPDYIGRDDLTLETCRIGQKTLAAVEGQIGRMSLAGVEHYAAARGSYDRILKENSADDVPTFLEAIDGIVEDLKRFDYPTRELDSRPDVLQLADMLDLRIRRYEAAALAAVMEPPATRTGAAPAV